MAAAAGGLLSFGRTREPTPGASPPALGGTAYTGDRLELSFWHGFTGGDAPAMRELVESLGDRTVSRLVEICGDPITLAGEDRRREYRVPHAGSSATRD